MISKSCSKANKNFLKSCNVKKSTSYIIYLDGNNLYGHSGMQLLQIERLVWVNSKEFNVENYSKNSLIGVFWEIYHGYSKELHDLHNYYPLVGEKTK